MVTRIKFLFNQPSSVQCKSPIEVSIYLIFCLHKVHFFQILAALTCLVEVDFDEL